MSKYAELRNDFFDETENKIYIDAWFTDDDNEEGVVIAKVNMTTKEVEYLDNDARKDSYAQEIIKETIDYIENGRIEMPDEILINMEDEIIRRYTEHLKEKLRCDNTLSYYDSIYVCSIVNDAKESYERMYR